MNVTTEQEAYLDAVKRALADLDPATRDELLEDLPEHLAEVAAEGEGPLADRLGPPEAYAAEMRAAAGLDVPPPSRGLDDRVTAAVRTARGALGTADRKIGPIIGYGRFSEFLRMLLPSWWVLRGYLVAMLITVATTGGGFGLLPRLGGSTLAAVLLLAVCVTASIWLGRREASLPPVPRAGVVLGGVLLFFFGLVGFDKADLTGDVFYDNPVQISNNPYETVQDVYVYDENGQPLTKVRIYDQDGQPIRIGDPYRCADVYGTYGNIDPAQAAYPYCPDRAPYRVGPRPGLTGSPTPTPTPLPTPAEAATPTPTAAPTSTN